MQARLPRRAADLDGGSPLSFEFGLVGGGCGRKGHNNTLACMQLYTSWILQAAFRVRLAFQLNRLEVEANPANILKGDRFAPRYRDLNPATADASRQ
jgi:hypothetical protein